VTVGELDLFKGNYRDSEITLRLDGGELGNGKVLVVHGIPEFFEGQKVVLFVKGNGRSICPLVGWEQGMLRVAQDEKTGQEIVLTSQGVRISKIDKGDFVLTSSPLLANQSVNEVEFSAGRPEDGEGAKKARLDQENSEPLFTIEELTTQVHHILAKVKGSLISTEEVQSAEVKLDSPGFRAVKTPPVPMQKSHNFNMEE
jgi:hypothetical protein